MSLKNIPTNWCVTTIGDINDYKSLTFNPKSYQEDSFELYSVPSFASGSPEILLGKDIASNKQYIQFKDILLCKINPRINRVWCVKEKKENPQIGSSEWIVIRQPLIHEGFLAYFLQTQDFRDLLCSDVSGVGGSLTRAQPKRVATYNVPIAPLPEQKIIAEKLDTLLAQVDSTKARLEQIPQILKRFRQAVLASAVDETQFKDSEFNKFKLSEISNFQSGFAFKSSWFTNIGSCQIVKLANIRDGHLFLENAPSYIDEMRSVEFNRFAPNIDDILISMTGTRYKKDYGFCCIIKDKKKILINQRVGRVMPLKEFIVPEYLLIFMRSELFREQFFKGETGGVNQGNVGAKHIESIIINTPTLSKQHEIVRRVEQLFAYADTIEKQVNNALARVNNLTQSILAKAFRGELTAQWRAENPDLISGENSAAALLEKIKAERAASGGKKASRKKS